MYQEYIMHAAKGIQKSYNNAMGTEISKYKDTRLFNFKNTSEWNEIFTSTEGMSGVKKLTEHEEPPILTMAEGYQTSMSPDRYGAGIVFTQDDYMRAKDNTNLIDEILSRKRDQLMTTGIQSFLLDIYYLYNNAFNASSEFLAPDGVEVCGTHSWKSGGTFSNKGTSAFGSSAIATLMAAGGDFKDASGRSMPISYNTFVFKLGSEASNEAKRIFANNIQPTAVADVNIYKGAATIIEAPMIDDGDNWFAYDSKYGVPFYVGIHKMFSMDEPIRKENNSVLFNATAYYKRGIPNLPFGFYGSTGKA